MIIQLNGLILIYQEDVKKLRLAMKNQSFKPIHSGVPQGSILGSLLFVIFINDLPLVLQNVYADLYADDTTLHKSTSSVSVLNVELNTDLHNVVEWYHENNMVLNTEKKTYVDWLKSNASSNILTLVLSEKKF
jgi:hypothetical protein